MTTEELLAVAVLKGDHEAARALADHIVEHASDGSVRIPPVKHVVTDVSRIRIVLFVKGGEGFDDAVFDREGTTRAIHRWLTSSADGIWAPLCLRGFDRMEIYELPEEK